MTIPSFVWPLVLAVVALLTARVLARHGSEDPRRLPSRILQAVAVGCVVIGIATWWLDHAH